MVGKSPRSRAYEEWRFCPTGNLNTRRHLKIEKKDVYFKYISVLREKYRYKVLRYLGCILSENGLITRLNILKVGAFLMLLGNEFHILGP